jgi:hypothetical protein
MKSNLKKKLFDYELCYKDSEKNIFFVVCEVIIIENVRSANSGPQNLQLSPSGAPEEVNAAPLSRRLVIPIPEILFVWLQHHLLVFNLG